MNKKYNKVRGLGELLLLGAGKNKNKPLPWEDRKLSWTQIIRDLPIAGRRQDH